MTHPPEHPDNRPPAHRWPLDDAEPGRPPGAGAAGARFVVHVPLLAPDLTAALRLARVLAHRSASLPGLDVGGTTVSDDGEWVCTHRAFCDRALSRRHRCRLTTRHAGPCRP